MPERIIEQSIREDFYSSSLPCRLNYGVGVISSNEKWSIHGSHSSCIACVLGQRELSFIWKLLEPVNSWRGEIVHRHLIAFQLTLNG